MSATFKACDAENGQPLRQAVETIYQQHGRAGNHDDEQNWQVLDIDMSLFQVLAS